MKYLVLALAVFVVGCSAITAPQPGATKQDFSGYGWSIPSDSALVYSVDGVEHVIRIDASGRLTDSKSDRVPTASLQNGTYSIGGISPSTLLPLDDGSQLVADTAAPVVKNIVVSQIFESKDQLYASDGTMLYHYRPDSLLVVGPLPAPGVQIYVNPIRGEWYAYNSTSLFLRRDAQAPWTPAPAGGPTGITTVYADGLAVFFGTSSDGLWSFVPQLAAWNKEIAISKKIVAIASYQEGPIRDHLYLGLADGSVIDSKKYPGPPDPRLTQLGNITGLWSPDQDRLYIASSNGVVVFDRDLSSKRILSRPITSVDPDGLAGDLLATTADGHIEIISQDHSVLPVEVAVSSKSVAEVSTTSVFMFALVDGQILSSMDLTNWTPVNQTQSQAPSYQPGVFKLLVDNQDTFVCANVIKTAGGHREVFPYTATRIDRASQLRLDSMTFKDVIIMQYAYLKNGLPDSTDVPMYTVYFERGLGPIRIEVTHVNAGVAVTDTTQFLRKIP